MDINDLESEFFKALGHPIRIKILNVLKEQNCCVSDMTKHIKEAQPQVSRHLSALRQAGIVIFEKKGTSVCYRVKNKDIFRLLDISRALIKDQNEKIMGMLKD